jgi:hypothetical protein
MLMIEPDSLENPRHLGHQDLSANCPEGSSPQHRGHNGRLEWIALCAHQNSLSPVAESYLREAWAGIANLRQSTGVYLRTLPVDESSPTCHIETFHV